MMKMNIKVSKLITKFFSNLFFLKKTWVVTITDELSPYNNQKYFVRAKNPDQVELIMRKHFTWETFKYERF